MMALAAAVDDVAVADQTAAEQYRSYGHGISRSYGNSIHIFFLYLFINDFIQFELIENRRPWLRIWWLFSRRLWYLN